MRQFLFALLPVVLVACKQESTLPPSNDLPIQPEAEHSVKFTRAYENHVTGEPLERDYYIHDWRYAGNKIAKSIPDALEYQTFYVDDFGANPDDGQDDLQAIQQAVSAAESAGGGYVIFSPGQYDLNVNDDSVFSHDNAIWVKSSNVFLIGQEEEGRKTKLKQWKLVTKGSGSDDHVRSDHTINFGGGDSLSLSPVRWINQDRVRGDTYLPLNTTSQFKVGDMVNIKMMSWLPPRPEPSEKDFELENELLYPLYSDGLDERNAKATYQPFEIKRRVTAVSTEGITIDAPLPRDIPVKFNPAVYIEYYKVSNCGVKNMHLIGPHDGSYAEGGYDSGGVNFRQAVDCWAENLILEDHVLDISLNSSREITIRDISVNGQRGHHGIGIYNSDSNVIENVTYDTSREHMITFNGLATENVVSNVENLLHNVSGSMGIDFHSGFSSFNLLDNIKNTKVSSRGAAGGNSSSGQHNVLWNVTKGNHQNEGHGLYHYCWYTSTAYSGAFEKYADCFRRHPRTLYVGLHSVNGPEVDISINHLTHDHVDEWKYVEGINDGPVYPRSLFEAQQYQSDHFHPEIIGVETVSIKVGESFEPLDGVFAVSELFGDLTSDLRVIGIVDTDTTGTYKITYDVTDRLGYRTTLDRYVVVAME